jgi:CheY-like chemotaxis protein
METQDHGSHPPRLRVLVVDDDSEVASSLGFLIEILGAKVAIALSAHTGAKVAEEFKPDIAFIDLEMPGADGCKLLEMLHAPDCDCGTPVCVCLTSREGFRVEERCREAGFDGFVRKPLEVDALEFMLTECRKRLEQTRQHIGHRH